MGLGEQLANLSAKGSLVAYAASSLEVRQHIETANSFLVDAKRAENSPATRFSVANGAAHALLTAAIKMHGYRPTLEKGHRVILYQLLDTLLPAAAGAKESLLRAHNGRNKSEYDGEAFDVTNGQVDDLIAAVANVKEEVDLMFRAFQPKHVSASKMPETKG
jgi:hypothetical protein